MFKKVICISYCVRAKKLKKFVPPLDGLHYHRVLKSSQKYISIQTKYSCQEM